MITTDSKKSLITGSVTILLLLIAVSALAQSTFTATGSMNIPRFEHAATLLLDGKVLIVGGQITYACCNGTNSAEIYDPMTDTFTPTGSMSTVRAEPTATLLNNGKVLIAGGSDMSWPYGQLASAELYDPNSGTFVPTTGNMSTPRAGHSAVLLANGQVLLVGGQANSLPGGGLASAEIYDPTTDTFTGTGSMSINRYLPPDAAILLNNGQVLVAGGQAEGGIMLDGAEIYDPASGTFTLTGTMNMAHAYHFQVTLLNNGQVLITGGGNGSDTLDGAELYNPVTGTFSLIGNMSIPRDRHRSTLLNNGEILIAGGDNSSGSADSAEIYDPAIGSFTPIGNMTTPRTSPTATLLNDGSVLMTGGFNTHDSSVLSSSELYALDTTPPTDGALTVIATDGQNALSWSGFSDAGSGIDHYILRFRQDTYPASCSDGTLLYSGSNISYTHTGLTNGTKYFYRLCAVDNTNNVSPGVTANAIYNSLLLTSPNGGETWVMQYGGTQQITWQYTGYPGGNVRIELLKGGSVANTIASNAPIGNNGSGSYNWAMPTNLTPGYDYQIRIASTTTSYTDISDGNFTIDAPPSIIVKSPNGPSDPLYRYDSIIDYITWGFTGNPGPNVRIELLRNGTFYTLIKDSTPISTGRYQWKIPSSIPGGCVYKVRVASTTNGAVTDTSNNNFCIW